LSFFLVVLGFEFKASCLLGRCSTTWVPLFSKTLLWFSREVLSFASYSEAFGTSCHYLTRDHTK
jgi:hypothetical protein